MTPDQVEHARDLIADHLQLDPGVVSYHTTRDGPGYFVVPRALTQADQHELRMLLVGYLAEVRAGVQPPSPMAVSAAQDRIATYLGIPRHLVWHTQVHEGSGYFTVPGSLDAADHDAIDRIIGQHVDVRTVHGTTVGHLNASAITTGSIASAVPIAAVPHATRVVVRVEMSDGTWTEAVLTREDPDRNPVAALAVLIDPGFPDPEIRPGQLTVVDPSVVKPTGYKVDVRGADHLVVRTGHDG